MHFGANFLICSRADEDVKCSNSLGYDYTANDHLHYFQHNVGTYGQNNCVDKPDPSNKVSRKNVSLFCIASTLLTLYFLFI